jgi:hypothetical protein
MVYCWSKRLLGIADWLFFAYYGYDCSFGVSGWKVLRYHHTLCPHWQLLCRLLLPNKLNVGYSNSMRIWPMVSYPEFGPECVPDWILLQCQNHFIASVQYQVRCSPLFFDNQRSAHFCKFVFSQLLDVFEWNC